VFLSGIVQAQPVSSSYSTEASGSQAQANASYITMLETLNDVDRPEDLPAWERRRS